MPLKIQYGVKHEKQRIKKTIAKLLWFEKLGYSPRFPKNINPEIDNLEKIYAALLKEYAKDEYKKATAEININFPKVENIFYDKLRNLLGQKIRKNYRLILTKYGVGGSYKLPNIITLNINSKSPVNTILHEITHLAIEPYIRKYGIKQNEKERIVDLILTSPSIALKNYKMQKRGKEHKKIIDPLFKEYFKPPINNFFKKLAESRNIN